MFSTRKNEEQERRLPSQLDESNQGVIIRNSVNDARQNIEIETNQLFTEFNSNNNNGKNVNQWACFEQCKLWEGVVQIGLLEKRIVVVTQ